MEIPTCPYECGNHLMISTTYRSDGVLKCGKCRGELSDFALDSTMGGAKRFDPIAVWISNTDPNDYQIPGRNHEEAPAGYHKVELTTLREVDAMQRRLNGIEREKGQAERHLQNMYWDERTRERRDNIRAKIRGNPRAEALFRQVCAVMDKKREEKRAVQARWDPRVNFQIISKDSSNRNGYADRETGWKQRKY